MKLALQPIVDQLIAAGCRNVAGIIEFSAQTVEPRAKPAFFVVPIAEQPQPNTLSGARDQKVDVRWSVMVVLEGARRHAAGISEDVKIETDRVADALTGWTHPDASRPTDYDGGRLASADGSTVVWEVRFRSTWHLRKAS